MLEVGCGHGLALAEICARIGPEGRAVGLDRSAKMIAAAGRSCAAYVESGTATLVTGALAQVPLGTHRFDLVFAINVRLFADAGEELERVSECLTPEGELHLFFETPGWAHAEAFMHAAKSNLAAHGFCVTARAHPPVGVHLRARAGSR